MSSSSMCQTIYDTVHTSVYDTIHSVSFDTVRTFDTVRVQLDSVFTIDLLNKAQNFYSDSFSDLQMVFTIFIAIIAIIVGYKFFNDNALLKRTIKDTVEETKNTFNETFEEQRQQMSKLTSFVKDTQTSFQKTADDMKTRFKESFDKQTNETARLLMLVKEIHEQGILNWITQARLAKTQNQDFHSFMCYDYALDAVVKHYDKTFVQYGRIALEELGKNISVLNTSANKVKIIQSILEKIENFKNCLLNTNYDSDKNMADKEKTYVNDSLSLITSMKLLFEHELKESMQ